MFDYQGIVWQEQYTVRTFMGLTDRGRVVRFIAREGGMRTIRLRDIARLR